MMSMSTSTTQSVNNLTSTDVQELLNSGYEQHSIKKVDHFSATSEELTELLGFDPHADGLAFVYKKPSGELVEYKAGLPFVRVKMHRTKEEIEIYGKYNSPKDGGAHLYLSDLYQGNWETVATRTKAPIIITEGEKKADVLCQEGLIAIGISGVNSWKCKKPGHDASSPLDDFKWFDWRERTVYLCPDSDINDPNKPQIKRAMQELAEWLTDQYDAHVKLIILPSDLDGSKLGADDFIKKYGAAKFGSFLKNNNHNVALKYESKSKNAKRILNMTPPDNQRKSEIVSWFLAETYATRSMVGWYEWIGTYWKTIDEDSVRNIVRDAYEVQDWRLNNEGDVKFAIAENKVRLKVNDIEWNKPGHLIFNNGVYTPSLNIFRQEFDKTLYATTPPLPFPYSIDRKEPTRFLKFLDEATGGDTATIELLQAIMKYTWMPKDRSQKFPCEAGFDFYGGKGTGKSTFLEIIQAGLGQDAIASADPVVFTRPELLFDLLDKKAAISTDISGYLNDVGVLNRVISNEPVLIRKLRQQSLTTRLGVVVLRSYNKFVSVGQGSDGLDRRLLVVHFNRTPSKIDTDLLPKLLKELPEIFFWAFSLSDEEMVKRIKSRNGSELAAKASIERFIDNNPVYQYLMDHFEETGATKQKAQELYCKYEEWCRLQHFKPCKASHFRQEIEKFGASKELKADGTAKNYGGYPAYNIPAMKDFDIRGYLGISKEDPYNKTEVFEPSPDPIVIPEEVPVQEVIVEEKPQPVVPLELPTAEEDTGFVRQQPNPIEKLKEKIPQPQTVEPVQIPNQKPERERLKPSEDHIEAVVAKIEAAIAEREKNKVESSPREDAPEWVKRMTAKNPKYYPPNS